MRLLLDSHAFIWMMVAPDQLSPSAREKISDGANELIVSAASLWELVLKEGLGKLAVPTKVMGLFKTAQDKGMISFLGVEPPHLTQLAKLPSLHTDPFDRLLIAQAIEEKLHVVTKDQEFRKYKVKRVW